MAKESKNTKLRSITIRVPEDIYDEYKEVLAQKAAIVTYDIRLHMKKVIEEARAEAEKVEK